MSRNIQSRKYLIGCSYKNDEFDWPFLFGNCIIARHESITPNGPSTGLQLQSPLIVFVGAVDAIFFENNVSNVMVYKPVT